MEHTLPVPDYDRVLLCDLPARIEGLDASELAQLLEHERSLAARPAVLSLLEERLADAGEHAPDPVPGVASDAPGRADHR